MEMIKHVARFAIECFVVWGFVFFKLRAGGHWTRAAGHRKEKTKKNIQIKSNKKKGTKRSERLEITRLFIVDASTSTQTRIHISAAKLAVDNYLRLQQLAANVFQLAIDKGWLDNQLDAGAVGGAEGGSGTGAGQVTV